MTPTQSRSLVSDLRWPALFIANLHIASKCDDISCSEVIRALNLDDDPELEAIEEEIDQSKTETEEWKAKKAEAEAAAHGMSMSSYRRGP